MLQEVVKEVQVPVVNERVEYVDRIVEKIVEVGGRGAGHCISEYQFVDLWNRMHSIPVHNLTDSCLTAERFVQLVSENIHGREGKDAQGGAGAIVYQEGYGMTQRIQPVHRTSLSPVRR